MVLTAPTGTTAGTDETAFLIDERLMSADRALLPLGFRAVNNIFFQRTLHAVLPRIDAFVFQLKRTNELHHVVYWHAVA